jgi:hypothetical protein
MIFLCIPKSLKLGFVFFKKSNSWDPTWTAGVLTVSRSVLAVNPNVQGSFIKPVVLYFKGELYHFFANY